MMLGLETISCYFVFLLYNDFLPFFFFFSQLLRFAVVGSFNTISELHCNGASW